MLTFFSYHLNCQRKNWRFLAERVAICMEVKGIERAFFILDTIY
jgi:hypothetical protein